MAKRPNLSAILAMVSDRVGDALANSVFHPSQRELLEQTAAQTLVQMRRSAHDTPLGVLYLIAKAWGRESDEQAQHVGAFCLLYLCAADLFDDVQDDDLAGKAHQRVGAPIAMNNAVTLLFLALKSLTQALELEPDPERRLAYLRLFNRVSVLAVAGQHRDLAHCDDAQSPDDVLRMHQAKTSSLSLVTECGALLSGCDAEGCALYRAVGERLAQLIQVMDDLRDIFGKSQSPDLSSDKMTYPMACFLEEATPEQTKRLVSLKKRLPESLPEIRQLLHESGAVERSAEAMEELREEIHHAIAATGNRSPAHRVFLRAVDRLSATVYEPDPIAETEPLFHPRGGFHDAVREAARLFGERMTPVGAPSLPDLEPWHLSHYMYEPARRVIYYPDLEGLPEEIVPFQAELLGTDDFDRVLEILKGQLPAVLAHEMFHYWRHAAGRLTDDSWHEEYAANRLAVGYVKRFSPATLDSALSLADQVLCRFAHVIDDSVNETLDSCVEPRSGSSGYGMDMLKTAVVHLEMVRRLADTTLDLKADIEALLSPAEPA